MDLKRETRHDSANGNLGPTLLVIMAIEGYQPLLFPGLARLELLWEGNTQGTDRKGKVRKVMVQSETFANQTKRARCCYLKYKKKEDKHLQCGFIKTKSPSCVCTCVPAKAFSVVLHVHTCSEQAALTWAMAS